MSEAIAVPAEPVEVAVPEAPVFRRLGHVPELDGIRGMAVLMTVVAHSFFAAASGGGLTGVAVFSFPAVSSSRRC